MGLDISSYSKIIHMPDVLPENGDFYVDSDDPFGTHGDLKSGSYSTSRDSDEYSFRAGSYLGYNRWREDLSMAIHGIMPTIIWHDQNGYKGKDFFEIICFSDCEGCFGPNVSSKLHGDFVKNRNLFVSKMHEKYPDTPLMVDHNIAIYDHFMKGFEIAKNSGILRFC